MARQQIPARPWSKHDRGFWERQSANPNIPLVMRVYSLAYGCHRANGHTPLRPGELARLLGQPATADRPARACPRQTLHDAIKAAKAYGYLDSRSSTSCLIVPQGQIQFGIGEAFELCDVCTKRIGRVSDDVATPRERVHKQREQRRRSET